METHFAFVAVIFATIFLCVVLATIAWIDARQQIIPNTLNLALAAGGAAAALILPAPGMANAIIGSAGGFAVLWAVRTVYAKWRGFQGLGFGDVKFVGAAGLWIGATGLPWMMLIAALSGLAWSVLRGLATSGLDTKQRLSFGPHLCVGLFAAWMAQALHVW